jgi:hypothetical protein
MKIVNKTKATSVIMILMFAISTFVITLPIPNVKGQIELTTDPAWFLSFVGENSPTAITWRLDPNILATDPDYMGKTPIWPNAVLTFTRPDGTTDVVNGPLNVKVTFVQGEQSEIQVEYTPNMMGTWTVNLYWPGDAKYSALDVTDTFYVGPHYEKRDTWAMLSLKPYPTIGVNQWLLVNAWITPPPPTNHFVNHDYLFTFTKPDGTSFEVGPIDSEAPGTIWFDLPLDMVGVWSIKFEYPGSFLDLPAEVTRTITVQQDPVPLGAPDSPLPTQEWTFPINIENREWRNIAGPWYDSYYNGSTCNSNVWTEPVKTAHILWTLDPYDSIGGFIGKPHSIETGGGEEVYGAGDAGIFSPSMPQINCIMAGRGYYTAGGMIVCIDMRTGEELWSVEGSFDAGAVRSRDPVLYDFGNSFRVYDAISGELELDVDTPGMSADFFAEPYVYSSPGDRLIAWDVSSSTSNFASRILWNVTNILPNTSTSHSMLYDGKWIARHFMTGGLLGNTIIVDYLTAIDLATGEMVYNVTTLDPGDTDTWVYRQGPAISAGNDKVFFATILQSTGGLGYSAYHADTGALAWESDASAYPWGNFWAYTPQCSAPGVIFGLSYAGIYAFDSETGEQLWHYIDPDTYNEQPYGSNVDPVTGEVFASYAFGSTGPLYGGGVLYATNTEHSPTLYYRGQGMSAIDVSNGELLWRILGNMRPRSMAYGILVADDSVSGATYAFSKGSTETTVSVSQNTLGSGVLIQGTVTDQSPAQPGTAAVADESMSEWMEYLHMQQPCPAEATGVEVVITTYDPNGNTYELGRATTDLSGNFGCIVDPPVPGLYKITATFEGSESYYPSWATTYMGVGPAATAAQPIEPELAEPTPTETELTTPEPTVATLMEPESTEPTAEALITTEIAIIAAVAGVCVVGVVAFWILRKRK